MFLERLSRIANRIEGARVLSLVGPEGIPIETVTARGEREDLDVLAAEMLTQLKAMEDNHREFGFGASRALRLETERETVMVGQLVNGYYLLLVQDASRPQGRARFELRRARLDFEADLV